MKGKVLAGFIVLILLLSFASAASRFVPEDYPTIGAAVGASDDGDEIIVDDGVYTGNGNRDIYLDRRIAVRSKNGPENCIIDCNDIDAEPHRAFVICSNATIAGFTIINGHSEEGGAIYCEYGSSPIINNCILKGNSAMQGGGAIYCRESNPTIINCTISYNSVVIDDWRGGGGICAEESRVNIVGSQIIHNSANSGGGISCRSRSNLIIKDCIISDNEAGGGFQPDSRGGGVYCEDDSDLTVVDSAICNNIVKGNTGGGGGIYFASFGSYGSTKLTVFNCSIKGNSVEGDWDGKGGGIFCNSVAVVSECIIEDNAAKVKEDRGSSYGGGIYCYQGRPIITKCRISNNSADEGGGIACERSSPIIAGSIISGNFQLDRDKFGDGGGIFCIDSSPSITNCTIVGNSLYGIICEDGDAAVTNSIVYYNGNGIDFVQIREYYAVVTYSDVQTHKPAYLPFPGTGNINSDPCFIVSGHWDANAVWVEGNYHLLSGSRCINAGSPVAYLLDSTDLDDNPRIIGQIDMGAYELKNNLPVANASGDQQIYAWIDNTAKVTLDGSGSYDADGDTLAYNWSWIIDGNEYSANGVNTVIELPTGRHTVNLFVNDGIADSEIDEIKITVIEPIESTLWFYPRVIHRHNRNGNIIVRLKLPASITNAQIDSDHPLSLYPGDINSIRSQVVEYDKEGRTSVVVLAFYDKADLLDAISNNGMIALQAVGRLKTGQYFYGINHIRIEDR